MQVLSLDRNITMEARLLRKELLAMFEVREFSKDGQFVNPSESLKVAEISCDNCTMGRSLDLCRDEDLLPLSAVASAGQDGGEITAAAAAGQLRPWRCTFCNTEFDRNEVEERLVADVERMLVEWSTQDLKCVRCGALRVNEFMEHCVCSGEWRESVKREEVLRRLGVYGRVAAFYGLRMLGSAVEGIVDGL
jgi:DNA polymerase epsilon subunit 1